MKMSLFEEHKILYCHNVMCWEVSLRNSAAEISMGRFLDVTSLGLDSEGRLALESSHANEAKIITIN